MKTSLGIAILCLALALMGSGLYGLLSYRVAGDWVQQMGYVNFGLAVLLCLAGVPSLARYWYGGARGAGLWLSLSVFILLVANLPVAWWLSGTAEADAPRVQYQVRVVNHSQYPIGDLRVLESNHSHPLGHVLAGRAHQYGVGLRAEGPLTYSLKLAGTLREGPLLGYARPDEEGLVILLVENNGNIRVSQVR